MFNTLPICLYGLIKKVVKNALKVGVSKMEIVGFINCFFMIVWYSKNMQVIRLPANNNKKELKNEL